MIGCGSDRAVFHHKGVIIFAATEPRGPEADAELDALHSGDAEDDGGNTALHAVKQRSAQSHGQTQHSTFHNAANGVILRLGGGDLNALVALIGFIIGIFIGVQFMKRGFSLRRNYTLGVTEGTILPALMLGLLILVVAVPSLFKFSEAGPGSLFAPFFAALGIALVVGALAQRSRLCMVGGIRDGIMFGDFKLLYGFVAIFAVVLAGNLITGHFNLGFSGQPVAHSDHLWNLLGMLLVGWGSVLLGGCPLRQLILAGEGNSDSTVTVFGMITGAAFAHNFGLAGVAASADAAGGVPTAGRIAVVIGIVFVLAISLLNMPKKADA